MRLRSAILLVEAGKEVYGLSASALAQPCLARPDNRLPPVGHLQFAEDIGDMVADSFGTEGKPLGDGGVGQTLRDQRKDLALAVGQFRENLGGRAGLATGEEIHHASGNRRTEDGLAIRNGADSAQSFLRLRAF